MVTKVPHAIWTATLSVSAYHLGKVEGGYERYTADDVPNQCWKHEANEIGEPGSSSDINKIEHIKGIHLHIHYVIIAINEYKHSSPFLPCPTKYAIIKL